VESALSAEGGFVKPSKRRLALTQERVVEDLPSIDAPVHSDASPETGRVSLSSLRSRGSRISQSVVLERELGRGAMGVVWLAKHETLGIPVAVKFLDGLVRDAPNQRFRVEGMVLARVSSLSRDIVRVLDAGVHEDTQFIVMEYVDGQSLETLLESGPVSYVNASSIVDRLATAIDHLHQAGYVHRDVKPANVLVTADFATVKLADFGVVKVLDPQQFGVRATATATVLGTPAYLSPEHLAGDVTSAEQDLWALAVTAYELVAGRLPFDAPTFIGLAAAICAAQFPKPSAVGLPTSLDAVFGRAFAAEVENRFSSATAFAEAFRVALAFADGDIAQTRAITLRPVSSPDSSAPGPGSALSSRTSVSPCLPIGVAPGTSATPPWLPMPRDARSHAEIETPVPPAPAPPPQQRGWVPIAIGVAAIAIAAAALLSLTLSRRTTSDVPQRSASIIVTTQTAIPPEPTHAVVPSAEIVVAPVKTRVQQPLVVESSAPSASGSEPATSASASPRLVDPAPKPRNTDKSEVF